MSNTTTTSPDGTSRPRFSKCRIAGFVALGLVLVCLKLRSQLSANSHVTNPEFIIMDDNEDSAESPPSLIEPKTQSVNNPTEEEGTRLGHSNSNKGMHTTRVLRAPPPKYTSEVKLGQPPIVLDASSLQGPTTPALDRLTAKIGRIYCAIPSIYYKKKFALWSAILNSWGPRCDVLKIFVDPVYDLNDKTKLIKVDKWFVDEVSGRKAEIVVVPTKLPAFGCGGGKDNPDKECRNIWEKVWRMWVWVGRNDLDKAEWFLKVDDDTFFIPEMMKRFLIESKWKSSDPHYFGHRLHHLGTNRLLIAGAVTAFSHETLARVLPVYENLKKSKDGGVGECIDRSGAQEEIGTSGCLRTLGIHAEPTFNDRGEERVLLFSVSDTVRTKRRPDSKGWFFKNKPKVVQGGLVCCAVDLYAIHNLKDPQVMLNMNAVLYGKESAVDAAMQDMTNIKRVQDLVALDPKSNVGKDLVAFKDNVMGFVYLHELKLLWSVRANIVALRAGLVESMP